MAEAERLVKAGRQGAARHQPGHLRLRRRHQACREQVEGPAAASPLPRPVPGAGLARRLGAAALRLPLSARRRRAAADGGGRDPPGYLDIPFQHASPRVLKAMRRPAHQEKTLERLRRWREICPDLGVRSTFIVGFPGETEEDFAILLDWLKDARLARVGCFKYEPVDGAAANELAGAVPDEVKDERWHRLMAAQQEISRSLLAARVGGTIDVIIDGWTRRAPSVAPNGTRPRSTARYSSTAQPASRPATSSPPPSPTPTSTTCGRRSPSPHS